MKAMTKKKKEYHLLKWNDENKHLDQSEQTKHTNKVILPCHVGHKDPCISGP